MASEQRPEADRSFLRAELRRARRAVSGPRRHAAARTLAVNLWRLPVTQRASRIAVYMANDGEIDPALFARRLARAGRCCYLPVVMDRPRPGKRLRFARHLPGTPLRGNRYGIPEPCNRAGWLTARQLDLVIVPLVAFDTLGNRLGRGGGYFDRTLAYLRRRRFWHRPRLVGVGYAFQQRAAVPTAAWDVPLHQVVTERGAVKRPPGLVKAGER